MADESSIEKGSVDEESEENTSEATEESTIEDLPKSAILSDKSRVSLATSHVSFDAAILPDKIDDSQRKSADSKRSSLFALLEPLKKRLSTAQLPRGLSWPTTSLFLVADLVGGGIVAMPVAFINTGLATGIIFMVVICFFFAVTGLQLGQNWVIMQERWPIYRTHCRKPYPEMALRAMGYRMRMVAYFAVYLTQFGTNIVYLILPAKTIVSFVGAVGGDVDLCMMILIVAVCILPVTFLKSPADFWFVIVIAMGLTLAAVSLILVSTGIDLHVCMKEVSYPSASFLSALLSLGTFQFAFNGHHVFPTIQHDMYNPADFSKSVSLGFVFVALFYMPLSIFAYVVYGGSMRNSVIDSVQIPWIRYTADLAIGLHCLLALLITINPINQQLENIFHAPHTFCLKRVVIRTCHLAVVLFIAESVPDFNPIMNVFGSTTIPLSCITLPTFCNLWLNASHFDEDTKEWVRPTIKQVWERSPKKKIAWTIAINIITIVCAVVGCYMAITDFAFVSFTPPCYVRPFLNKTYAMIKGDEINCCGKYGNLSSHGHLVKCFFPKKDSV